MRKIIHLIGITMVVALFLFVLESMVCEYLQIPFSYASFLGGALGAGGANAMIQVKKGRKEYREEQELADRIRSMHNKRMHMN